VVRASNNYGHTFSEKVTLYVGAKISSVEPSLGTTSGGTIIKITLTLQKNGY